MVVAHISYVEPSFVKYKDGMTSRLRVKYQTKSDVPAEQPAVRKIRPTICKFTLQTKTD